MITLQYFIIGFLKHLGNGFGRSEALMNHSFSYSLASKKKNCSQVLNNWLTKMEFPMSKSRDISVKVWFLLKITKVIKNWHSTDNDRISPDFFFSGWPMISSSLLQSDKNSHHTLLFLSPKPVKNLALASLTSKKLQTGVLAFFGIKLLGNLTVVGEFLYSFSFGVFFGIVGGGPKLSSEIQIKCYSKSLYVVE